MTERLCFWVGHEGFICSILEEAEEEGGKD